MLGKVR